MTRRPLRPDERTAYVALGSNVGDRRGALDRAVEAMEDLPGTRVERVSSWFDTAPVGGPAGQPRFLNGVARLRTRLAPADLLSELQSIETATGRDRAREERHGPRTLDLDLLLYEGERSEDESLLLPHPRMEEREFVLRPLAEIEPELRLPRSGRTVRERAGELSRER